MAWKCPACGCPVRLVIDGVPQATCGYTACEAEVAGRLLGTATRKAKR